MLYDAIKEDISNVILPCLNYKGILIAENTPISIHDQLILSSVQYTGSCNLPARKMLSCHNASRNFTCNKLKDSVCNDDIYKRYKVSTEEKHVFRSTCKDDVWNLETVPSSTRTSIRFELKTDHYQGTSYQTRPCNIRT